MECDNSEFWHQVNSLSRSLFLEWRQQNAKKCHDGEKSYLENSHENRTELLGRERNEILRKIERVVLQLTRSVSKGEAPVYSYNSKSSWENVSFQSGIGIGLADNQKLTHVRFESLQSVKKFGLMTRLLSIIYKLVQQNKFCTKRDIFYQYPELFGSQSMLDKLVDTIACMLETPRWQLHVLATCKGSVAGDLHFYTEERHLVDCSATRTGVQIPAHTKDMQHMSTCARFVLIVEKDATFQKLVGDDFCRKFGPCIMVTGKGFPDLGTRLLLRRIWDNFHLPMFALVDADPHGVEIMAVYKHGSKAQAAENRYLAVPSIRWIGVLPSDINRLNIHESVCIPFTKKDMDKASELLSRPYVRENLHLMEQIQHMIEGGVKCEIQCLDSLSPSYLTDVYLPAKLRYGGWI